MFKNFNIYLNPKRTMYLWFCGRGLRWHTYNRGWYLRHDWRVLNLGRLTIDY